MGVNGLWKLLEPVGRPVTLESLEKKTLAVDISVWLNQALYGMRNQHGDTIPNAHLVLLFQRICKLLFYRIKPIFVFDGGVPELKKKTMAARREIRLSARHSARKVSEKVLKKYIKSRVIGAVTGKGSPRSAVILSNAEPEQDLFELPPLPEENEMKSSSEDESFFQAQNFQEVEGMDIDSKDFKKLPPEIRHELIVEMREKNKRHSRYQAIDMPEECNDFSTFQLNHLLKRGKLTQRLGTIRKEMNERRAGELVVDISQTGVEGDSIIQSQKIMSEESSHYILIKRSETKKSKDIEVSDDEMAGGFFRERSSNDQSEKPFVFTSLPRVSDMVAQASVSRALDENASSTDGASSIGHGFQDVADLSVLSPTGSGSWEFSKTNEVIRATPSVSAEGSRETIESLPEAINDSDNPCSRDQGESYVTGVTQTSEVKDDGVEDVTIDVKLNELAPEDRTSTMLEIPSDRSKTNSQELNKEDASLIGETRTTIPEVINVDEADAELEDLEDEINQRKMLIENLLSNRGATSAKDDNSKIVNEKEAVVSDIESIEDDSSRGGGTQNISSESFVSVSKIDEGGSSGNYGEIEVINEAEVGSAITVQSSDNARVPSNIDEAPPVCVESGSEIRPVVNEFEGKTYEELGEMQAQLNEDLDNLKEERSRQNRLAATVSDEMYKDSQELLQLFGIPFVVSPMEAEAQCATLNTQNLCEGSITEDSDIMLFGGKKVYKNVFNQNKNAELYQEDDVKSVLGLDQQSLITIALLTGSDYTEGVRGVGVVSAMEVINEFPGEGIEKLKNLKKWLEDTRKLGNSSHKTKLKSKLEIQTPRSLVKNLGFQQTSRCLEILMKHPSSMTVSLPIGFPSHQVFEAYLKPAVNDSSETFSWANPDLHALRLFASEKLGWSKSRTDEILLPVLKRLNTMETQSKIDAFFPVQFNEKTKIKSCRVKRVVDRLLNKEQDDDNPTQNIPKPNSKRRKRKKPSQSANMPTTSCGHENLCLPGSSSPKKKTFAVNDLSAATNEASRNVRNNDNSSTDSTPDTSDDDRSYVPFKKAPIMLPRGRGCGTGTRPRRRAKRT